MYVKNLRSTASMEKACRRLDNRAAIEVDTSGAKIGPLSRRWLQKVGRKAKS
jgi:hypothetical protein